ncbi:hypothetical protein OG894_42520 (plasmid) [Streptomyces sp. NBC_01724]|uniref:hypothetical protein n=1 Tax=Streptomyces sp. NBC_01724 TaxID=2975922 RepID=UPI002E341CDF|nr:hypothetical protein [Streptomyces sp. NBC_01724]
MTDLAPLRQAAARAEQHRAALAADATPEERRTALIDLNTARKALHTALQDFVNVPDADTLLARLDPSVPLMLTPVRLETRLRPDGDRPDTLLVRIFPDDIHLETHEAELTDGEVEQGRRYWSAVWRAGQQENGTGGRARIQLGAWDQLAGSLGPERARWVARMLAPPVDNRPAQPLPEDAPTPPLELSPADRRSRGWNRPATASTLPDAFLALAYQGDNLVGHATGKAVPDQVQVGPDPDAGLAAEAGTDPSPRWVAEFTAAEEDGLAITVPLRTDLGYDPGRRPLLSRVLVVGVSASLSPQESADRVAALLSDHAQRGDAAFLAQGTPTNHTAASRRTWSAAPDADSMLREAAGGAPVSDPLNNADVTATALGVPPTALNALPGAAEPEQADARALQLALWSATGDFFLDQLLESDSLTEKLNVDRGWLRLHYADHVRARGPLPVLRVGKQPYGLLPVTSMTRWQPAAGVEHPALAGLHRVLTTLRPFWDVGVPTLPRVGGPDQPGETLPLPKPERDVLRALGMSPVSRACDVRAVRGAVLACYQNQLAGNTGKCGGSLEDRLSDALNLALGIDYKPVISHHQNGAASPLWLPFVRPLSPTDGIDPIDELSQFLEQVVDRFDARILAVRPEHADTLLKALLRHVANLEYGYAAAAAAHPDGRFLAKMRRPAQVVLSPEQAPAVTERTAVGLRPFTAASMLQLRVQADPARDSITAVEAVQRARSELKSLVTDAATKQSGVLKLSGLTERPWSTRLVQLDAALQYLADRVRTLRDHGEDAFAHVERLLGECLDLVSHRLDAWITSMATSRLAAMRALPAANSGLQLGAYGWVEDLDPRQPGKRSDGWVLAPSLGQATTAAVLRSGALSHPTDPGAFAVDLSSRRMRAAMTVLDGVRQGQPLGALLGYRLERRLHELELDHLIAPLRTYAPLQPVQHPAPGDQTAEAQKVVAAHDVTDGARLADRSTDEVLAHLGALAGPAGRHLPRTGEARTALDALHDDVDALADLLLAESVHQLTSGNPDRAGATLESLAAGGQPPPRPEVLDIPRQGIPVTHRILLVVPDETPPAPGWDSETQLARPRAKAEPRLNAWASHQLGPAERIRLRAAWARPGQNPDEAVVEEHPWPLTDHCALDVAALAAGGALRTAVTRALTAPHYRPSHAPADAVPVPQDDRDPAWARSVVSLTETEALGTAIAATLAAGRPGTAADLTPAASPAPQVPDGKLRARAHEARDDLAAAAEANDLELLSQYGVAVGDTPPDGESATRLNAAVQQANSRVKQADKVLIPTGEAGPAPATEQADTTAPAAALEAVFGPGFRAVDVVTVTPPAAAKALTASVGADLGRADAHGRTARDWLEQMASVRTGTAALADLLMYAEAAGTGGDFAIRVAQTPFSVGDHWVGTAGGADGGDPAPATGLVIHGPAGLDPSQSVAVVVVDEWTEVIPARTHTAGVSFHFDAPGARPPQAVLLAVPPVLGAAWTLDTLSDVVREALELAKLRLVDLQALGWLGRYLPAAYLPVSELGTMPSVDLKSLIKHTSLSGRLAAMTASEA